MKFKIFSDSLFIKTYEKVSQCSHLNKTGGARGRKLRTLAALPCLIGVVRNSWQQGYFTVHPIRKKWGEIPEQTEILLKYPEGKHLIHLSENWSNAVKKGFVASSTEIAEKTGLSSGRVRQIIRLSNLPPEIVAHLKSLQGSKALSGFSENKLRRIIPMKSEDRLKYFESAFGVKIEV